MVSTLLAVSLSAVDPGLHASIERAVQAELQQPRVEVRIEWHQGRAKTAVHVGVMTLDLLTTEWRLAKNPDWHEQNPLPGMNHRLGRIAWLPAQGIMLAYVDRQLSVHGRVRWARAWRIAWWVGEIIQSLCNVGALPPTWTPATVLMPFKRSHR